MRNVDNMLKDFGRQWLSLAFQFYTAPQVFRLTNKEGANKFFKFHMEARDTGEIGADGKPKQKKVAVVRDYVENNGQYLPAEEQREYEVQGDFDVRVNTISGLPFTKSENENRLYQLFDRQIIDAEEVLSRLEYPNKEAITQRMAAAAQAAAQAGPPQQGE